MKLTIGGRYNWKGQPERLVYLGNNFSGNGFWHQFAKVESPEVVWCEVKGYELGSFEESAPDKDPRYLAVRESYGGVTQGG